jgi:ArsR family transcriptional regulator
MALIRPIARCVCDLTAALGVPQPAASRHLAYLRRADLVRVRRHGSWSYYRLAPARRAVHRALLNCLGACVRDTAQPSTGRTPVRRRSASACPR